MAQIFCINCGNKIPEGAHFCPACGTPRPALPSDYQEQPQPYAPQQYQYAAPDMPPPLGPEQPYQQPYAPGLPPQQYPPKKKSNGGIIALIAVLALAALAGGGWALYKYVLKPSAPVENNEPSTSFSSEEDNTTYSTEESPIDSVTIVTDTDTVVVDNSGTNEDVVVQDPQPDVPSIPQEKVSRRRSGEPWGMTDEEAAQMRRNRQNVPSIPRSQQRQSRRNRYNGEPWGMTDEEAAQMNDGMPMGMTDEEAAIMREIQRRARRR